MGGAPSSQTTAQQSADLQATQQQNAFDSSLMSLFNKQYANQTNVLSYLQGIAKPIVAQSLAGQGMSNAALTSMRTSATDQLSSQYQAAQQALNVNNAGQMGGTNVLPSGVTGQLNAGLLNSEAANKASTQNQITQYNQSLATSNLWNGLNVMSGVGAQMNPLGYAGSATSGTQAVGVASNAQANLQNSINNANNSGFFGQMAQYAGGALGSALGAGGSNMLGGLPGIGSFFPGA
jgi:hypothetical protein